MESVESIMREKYNKILQPLIPVRKFLPAVVFHNATQCSPNNNNTIADPTWEIKYYISPVQYKISLYPIYEIYDLVVIPNSREGLGWREVVVCCR